MRIALDLTEREAEALEDLMLHLTCVLVNQRGAQRAVLDAPRNAVWNPRRLRGRPAERTQRRVTAYARMHRETATGATGGLAFAGGAG